MNNPHNVNIDGQKLKVLLGTWCLKHNTTIQNAARDTGHSKCYFHDAIRTNKIRMPGIIYLRDTCKIGPEKYVTDLEAFATELLRYNKITSDKRKEGEPKMKRQDSKMLKIDTNKLKGMLNPAMQAAGTDYANTSRRWGFSHAYLGNMINSGMVSPTAAYLIEKEFGIAFKSYEYVEKEEQLIEAPVVQNTDQMLAVLQTIAKSLASIESKLDNLQASSELGVETLADIKKNTNYTKPYVPIYNKNK